MSCAKDCIISEKAERRLCNAGHFSIFMSFALSLVCGTNMSVAIYGTVFIWGESEFLVALERVGS